MAFAPGNLSLPVDSCLSGLWASLRLGWPKSGIEKLKKEMARLEDKRDQINNQIAQVEREMRIPTNQVIQWLWEVETLEGQVADIEQDFQSISYFSCNYFHRTGGTSSQTLQEEDITLGESSKCWSIIRRVAKKLGEAEELLSRAGALDPIASVGPPEPTVTLPISHGPPVGIESYVEDIVGYIDGGEGGIIGIYGMGGVGKTTIMKSIQQHYLLKHIIFNRVIWVVASKDCQLKRLQMDIAKSLELKILQESDDEPTCGDKLFSCLKNTNCLLLLDDIWEPMDLQLLGMTHSATERGQQQQQQQSRKVVVFTTRSEIVCAQMKAEKKIKVKCLDSDRAWQPFEQNSDGDVLSSDAGIKFVAEELAKECAGLPVALMSEKKSWEAWKDAVHQIRDKHEWRTVGFLEDSLILYQVFKLSYDSLENDSIRECLLCCALWPEDYEINIFEQLIPCLIGCGIIREFNVINEAFTEGFSYLKSLMAANLLEQSSRQQFHYRKKYVKMHGVIRDMALLMVSGLEGNKRKWIVKAGIGLRHLPIQEEWQETELASFMSNQITALQEYGVSTFSQLSVLILHENRSLKTIPPSLFASMPRLKYLDLCCSGIRKLPAEIGSLTELQYLNLSFNPITILPAEFGCLGKLKYLLLKDTNLETLPNGLLSNLSMLKWLDIKGIYPLPEWWWDELKYFKGHHQLSVGIDIHATTDNIERLNELPNASIWHLTIDGDDTSKLPVLNLGTPQLSHNTSDNLELLCIRNLGLDRLVLTAGMVCKWSFRRLEIINLPNLQLLEQISLDGVVRPYFRKPYYFRELYNFRELYIFGCPMLKDVSWILRLPGLNILEIRDCQKIKVLISGEENSNSCCSIQSLSLWDLPNLTCIANQPLHFPYLEYIYVVNCPEFKKLSFGAERWMNTEIWMDRLKEIQGDETWWHNLVWEDESKKNFFALHFIPRRIF